MVQRPMNNPYSTQPDFAFWRRSVSENFKSEDLLRNSQIVLTKMDRIMSAGSCFASNIVPYLKLQDFNYLKVESNHSRYGEWTDNLGYSSFTAAYGNIYTPRHFLQVLQRALGSFSPSEKFWQEGEFFVDPFRPGMRFLARSEEELKALTDEHLKKTLAALNEATVFLFTLGLTESWISSIDGAVFPACPGTIRGKFDASIHEFKNFSYNEIYSDLEDLVNTLRSINPSLRVILTVSPVPLVATATNEHVLLANARSKAILRAAASDICQTQENCSYFPAFEIITGPQAPYEYFESDRRTVSQKGINAVMKTLIRDLDAEMEPDSIEKYIIPEKVFRTFRKLRKALSIRFGIIRKKNNLIKKSEQQSKAQSQESTENVKISRLISELECDEIAQDKFYRTNEKDESC
jgi:hypothetical protein